MRTRRSSAVVPLAAAVLLASSVAVVNAANPNATYSFTACWDDGSVTQIQGVRGVESWSATRATAASFNFENYPFAADYLTFPGSRSGSVMSGWLTPQNDGGALQGWLYNGRRVVASGSIPEPTGGWTALDPCPVD